MNKNKFLSKTFASVTALTLCAGMGTTTFAAENSPKIIIAETEKDAYAENIKETLLINAKAYYAENFDVKAYKQANPDLVRVLGDVDDSVYLQHYWDCGIIEGRTTGSGFDPIAFIINNIDKYIDGGLNDSGQYFVLESFMAKNPDLVNAFGTNYGEYLKFYLTQGIFEKRASGAGFDIIEIAEKYPEMYVRSNTDLLSVREAQNKVIHTREAAKRAATIPDEVREALSNAEVGSTITVGDKDYIVEEILETKTACIMRLAVVNENKEVYRIGYVNASSYEKLQDALSEYEDWALLAYESEDDGMNETNLVAYSVISPDTLHFSPEACEDTWQSTDRENDIFQWITMNVRPTGMTGEELPGVMNANWYDVTTNERINVDFDISTYGARQYEDSLNFASTFIEYKDYVEDGIVMAGFYVYENGSVQVYENPDFVIPDSDDDTTSDDTTTGDDATTGDDTTTGDDATTGDDTTTSDDTTGDDTTTSDDTTSDDTTGDDTTGDDTTTSDDTTGDDTIE